MLVLIRIPAQELVVITLGRRLSSPLVGSDTLSGHTDVSVFG